MPTDSLDDDEAVNRHYSKAYEALVKMKGEGANTEFLGLLEDMEEGETETAIMLTLAKKGIGPEDV